MAFRTKRGAASQATSRTTRRSSRLRVGAGGGKRPCLMGRGLGRTKAPNSLTMTATKSTIRVYEKLPDACVQAATRHLKSIPAQDRPKTLEKLKNALKCINRFSFVVDPKRAMQRLQGLKFVCNDMIVIKLGDVSETAVFENSLRLKRRTYSVLQRATAEEEEVFAASLKARLLEGNIVSRAAAVNRIHDLCTQVVKMAPAMVLSQMQEKGWVKIVQPTNEGDRSDLLIDFSLLGLSGFKLLQVSESDKFDSVPVGPMHVLNRIAIAVQGSILVNGVTQVRASYFEAFIRPLCSSICIYNPFNIIKFLGGTVKVKQLKELSVSKLYTEFDTRCSKTAQRANSRMVSGDDEDCQKAADRIKQLVSITPAGFSSDQLIGDIQKCCIRTDKIAPDLFVAILIGKGSVKVNQGVVVYQL